jgi:hypothetical protein
MTLWRDSFGVHLQISKGRKITKILRTAGKNPVLLFFHPLTELMRDFPSRVANWLGIESNKAIAGAAIVLRNR